MIPHQSILGVVLISTSIATATAYGHKNHNQSPSFPDDSSSILVGTNWQLSDINGAPAIRDEYEGLQGLSFLSEFELSGFDGCNQFGAEWSTVPSSSMITVHLGLRTRRGCGWMTEEQDLQMRDFMGVLIRQDAIAYSLSEDEQELTLYTDDVPTMTLTRIVDDGLEEEDEGDKIGEGDEKEEQMEDEPGLTSAAEYVSIGPSDRKSVKNEGVVGAEYVSISSRPPSDDFIARCLQRCEDRYIICNERGWGNCGSRRRGCFDDCFNPLPDFPPLGAIAAEYVSIGPSDRKSVKNEAGVVGAGAEYVSISSGTNRPNNDVFTRCLQRCEDRYIICKERGLDNCRSRADRCFDRCANPIAW